MNEQEKGSRQLKVKEWEREKNNRMKGKQEGNLNKSAKGKERKNLNISKTANKMQ